MNMEQDTNKVVFRFMLGLLMIQLLISLMGCQAPTDSGASLSAPIDSPVKGDGKIYVYGDEISAGDNVTNPYTKIVGEKANKTVVNRAYSSVNGGNWLVSGGTSTMNTTLSLSNNNLRDIGPNDIIIIFIGYNDVRWFGNVGGNYAAFVTPFLQAAYNTGATIYVLSPIKMNAAAYGSFAPLNNATDARMVTFANLLQNSALGFNSSGVKYVNLITAFNPTAGNLQGDLQYPNNAGHQVIADAVIAAMGL